MKIEKKDDREIKQKQLFFTILELFLGRKSKKVNFSQIKHSE